MSKILEEILNIIESKEKSIAEISKESGVLGDRLYSWKAKRGKPKGDDSVKLQNWLIRYKKQKGEVFGENGVVNFTDSTKGGGSLSIDEIGAYALRNQAFLAVLLDTVAENQALLSNRSAAVVIREKQDEVSKEEARLRGVLEKK